MADKVNRNKIIIEDLLRFATFTIIVHIALCITNNGELFDDNFLLTLIYTLIGLVFFHLYIKHKLM